MKPMELVTNWFKDASKHDYIGVIYLDVDDIQRHNDSFGHDIGDASLERIGQTINDIITTHPIVTHPAHWLRVGGDEFIVVVYDEQAEQTFEIAEKIRLGIENLKIKLLDSLASTRHYPDQIARLNSPHLTVSVGALIQDGQSFSPGTYPLDLAQTTCEKAKQAGKNKVIKLDMRQT